MAGAFRVFRATSVMRQACASSVGSFIGGEGDNGLDGLLATRGRLYIAGAGRVYAYTF